jgi:hypothetical protein
VHGREVFVVDAVRTPVGRLGGAPSHIACVAQPEAFNAAVTEHLERHL